MKILYFFLCVLQPICLPIPEVVTITFGEQYMGSFTSIVLGVIGTLFGITFMFIAVNKGRTYFYRKEKIKKQLELFERCTQKYRILVTGILFLIPVLPDEIVIIGAVFSGISYKQMLLVASVFKVFSFVLIAYSGEIGSITGINQVEVLGIEIMIAFILAQLMKNRVKGNNYADKRSLVTR